MKTLFIVLGIIAVIVVFVMAGKCLWKEWKSATARTADDEIYDLRWKIEYAVVTEMNELYFIKAIKELKLRPDIDQEKLNKLEIDFLQRFQVLHP